MIHKIFTIYDTQAKAYHIPFYMHQVGMAVRVFHDMANDPEHQFGKHPEDYSLYQIGVYDDEDGSTHSMPGNLWKELITTALEQKDTNGQISDGSPVLRNPEGRDTAQFV